MHRLHVPSAGAQLDWGYPLVRRAVQRGLQHAKIDTNYVTTDGFLRAGGGKPAYLSLLLLQAGDVERNPGPAPRYPCGVCRGGVGSGAVLCRLCFFWHHSRCVGLSAHDLRLIQRSGEQWVCAACRPAQPAD